MSEQPGCRVTPFDKLRANQTHSEIRFFDTFMVHFDTF